MIKILLLFSKIDPVSLLEKSLPACTNCTHQEYDGLEQFQNNNGAYDHGIGTTNKVSNDICNENKKLKSLCEKSMAADNLNEAEKAPNIRQSLKHKFGRSRTINENFSTLAPNKNISDIDWSKEEDAEKAHKSNVAKITFKTAKEQLLASNPAARRVLGTSRKAQAKFISPMIGANV